MQPNMDSSLDKILATIESISNAKTITNLEAIRVELVGKNGAITREFKTLASLSLEQKKEYASTLNQLKEQTLTALCKQKEQLEELALQEELKKSIDVTLPYTGFNSGSQHPISQIIFKALKFFNLRGFNSYSDNFNYEIEDEDNNFNLLNIPEHHPARSMQDTFFLKDNILRTHVSAAQPRLLKSIPLPLKAVVFGKVYRSDQPDSTHVPVFHQMECLYVDKECNFSQLKSLIDQFLQEIFGSNIQYRYRSSYFPFTEPSVEVDVWNPIKGQWLEILGAGMVQPKVLEYAGHDSKIYQGFAFGIGIERLAMLSLGLSDVRELYGSDLDMLKTAYIWQ